MMLKTKNILNETQSDKTDGQRRKVWPFPVCGKSKDSGNVRPVISEVTQLRSTNSIYVAAMKVHGGIEERNNVLQPEAPKTRRFLRRNYYAKQFVSSNYDDPESFHRAMAGIITLAQYFGMFPVTGATAPSPVKLRFVKFSFRTVYAGMNMLMIFFMTVLAVIHMMRTLNAESIGMSGGIAAATAGALFYGNTFMASFLFFRLTPRWVTLAQEWRTMEQFVDSNKSVRPRLRWKFLTITGLVLSLALIEHVLSILNATLGQNFMVFNNSPLYDFLYTYCMKSHAFIFQIINYNTVAGIYVFIVSKTATFSWNFMDVFIMLVSTGLAERYKTLNKLILSLTSPTTKNRGNFDWAEFREDYAVLSGMVKRVDNDLSSIILLSFVNNLYFICLQLLNGLSSPADRTLLSSVYFFGSFAFLIGRTVAVTLLTARINDQSKVALPAIYNCPASSFNTETERLQYQLTTDDICLTGLRFFSITRNFMLAVAGAIATYEVVLLQLNITRNKD